MASNFIYLARNVEAAITVLRVRGRVPAKRIAINWLGFQVRILALERKSGSTR